MIHAAAAVAFVWLGMVLAISFVEAPLKFRAPGVTVSVGLAIGRIVFRALNAIEIVLGVAMVVMGLLERPSTGVMTTATVVLVLLVIQLAVVRPRLNRRSDAVLAGKEGPRSHAHLVYVGLEAVKVVGLLVVGILALSA